MLFLRYNGIIDVNDRQSVCTFSEVGVNYTVLVVDDEHDQRHALVERVDWTSAGFTVVGEAENGVEALELVETLEPDLILTDIKMPMITGLELAARVRELRPATQIVILSGYDSFEYAQTAINYNIISYLLKPISSAELSEELFEIHRRMDERLVGIISEPDENMQKKLHRMSVDEFLLPLMLASNEKSPAESELLERAEELKIISSAKDENRFCVLVSKFKTIDGAPGTDVRHIEFIATVMSRYMHCESFVAYGRVVTLVVLKGEGEASILLDLPLREIVQTAKRMLGERCTIGVSREFSELSHSSEAYFQAITARRYTSDGAGEIRFINDQERDPEFEIEHIEKTVLKLEQLLKVGKRENLSDFVNELYEESTPESANLLVAQIIATVYRVTSSVSDKTDVVRLLSANPIFARITSYSSESMMKGELVDFCESAKAIIEQSQKRDSDVLCDKVVELIDQRYGDEELSLTEVSNILAVSPNYLSALIKKIKKKNFITLLTERRMAAAYDMLVCTSMKVLEISEKCGYSDQHYFSYCFKKFYGDSPNKVRAQSRTE